MRLVLHHLFLLSSSCSLLITLQPISNYKHSIKMPDLAFFQEVEFRQPVSFLKKVIMFLFVLNGGERHKAAIAESSWLPLVKARAGSVAEVVVERHRWARTVALEAIQTTNATCLRHRKHTVENTLQPWPVQLWLNTFDKAKLLSHLLSSFLWC